MFSKTKKCSAFRLLLLLLVATAIILHRQLLSLAAGVLIVDEPADGCDFVMLSLENDDQQIAVEMLERGDVRSILLVRGRKERCTELGLKPSDWDFAERQMTRFGVPSTVLTPIGSLVRDRWQMADCLSRWLAAHPDARVAILEERFVSRRLRRILDNTLDTDQAQRVKVVAVPNLAYDEDSWWRSRTGMKHFLRFTLHLCYERVNGRPTSYAGDQFDPDAYEQRLRRLGAARH